MLTIEKVKEMQQLWTKALTTQSESEMSALYAENAVLKPTLSPSVRRNREDILAYFTGGTKYNDYGFFNREIYDVHFIESAPVIFDDMAIDTGKYEFVKRDGVKIEAHYTFCYQEDTDQKVQIVAHHSSMSE